MKEKDKTIFEQVRDLSSDMKRFYILDCEMSKKFPDTDGNLSYDIQKMCGFVGNRTAIYIKNFLLRFK